LAALDRRNRRWRYRIGRLRRLIMSGRLLDVGADSEEFMASAGKSFDVTGTQVSDEAVRIARELFHFDRIKGTRNDTPHLAGGSFDAASLIHVLEHGPHPAGTVEGCRQLLRPGGWILIAVPNDSPAGWYEAFKGSPKLLKRLKRRSAGPTSYSETSPFGSVDLRNAQVDTEIHVSHFSIESLNALLSACGFDVAGIGPDPCYVTTGVRRFMDDLDRHAWALLYRIAGIFCYETVLIAARARTQ